MKKLTMMKFNYDEMPTEYWASYPFIKGQVYILLGELKQMPGHGVFVEMRTGKIYSGYDIDNFIKCSDEEV